MRLFLVRHGQSLGNAEERLQGQREYPLTALGRDQARRLGEVFKARKLHFDAVYVSPLGRALETLELMAGSLPLPAPEIKEELAEIKFGRLEGLRRGELELEAPEFLGRGIEHLADYGEFGGESYAAVQERVQALSRLLFERHREHQESVLIVGHGGLNFQLAKSLVCLPVPRVCLFKMGNCSATCIQMIERRGTFIGELLWHAPLELWAPEDEHPQASVLG